MIFIININMVGSTPFILIQGSYMINTVLLYIYFQSNIPIADVTPFHIHSLDVRLT